ncbi:alcohol dehydrogenase GroES-like domain-containing protein [Elsinoe ampelina]|uniref:Alcohol dehydrogenase GroES-like domain-containing protein n=1 Tax=Elsinoe ampelina TaxID=302913 RepID=A0A6A6GI06_9PEZI|nr:alcohol dehydrogenase GroES-like domain-containing protein [Elsinoe ampelina]
MSHLAAIQESPKAPFVIKEVPTPEPGEDEILIRNELIGLVPVDMKMAKYGIPPIASYPAILGNSFGGIVTAVGSAVTRLEVGDKVAVNRSFGTGNHHGPFQQFALAKARYAAKVSSDADLHGPVGTIGNITTIVAMLSGYMGLQRPDLGKPRPENGQKILVYGGTSSVGFLATQYLVQAGYDVVTTTSPKNRSLVSVLDAIQVVDHTQDSRSVLDALLAHGPYDNVIDAISLPGTTKITAAVLHAQGGGKLYTLLPPMGPEMIPETVERVFQPWATALMEEKDADLGNWAVQVYYQQALERGKLAHLPTIKVPGGLVGLNDACDILERGVSATKVVVDPRE